MATRQARSGASDAVDKQLARYRAMRDFHLTAEPSGKKSGKASPKSGSLPFVIQKHAATRLHYDFRLGWHGVLKSWAVTKGPSYYPGDKRLAVQVEDHPMEYGGFEGTIPKGQYGGGTVMVWDQGTWEPLGDVDEGLRRGNLKFTLHGTKLKGNWVLVRMHGKEAEEKKPNWLLIKEHDSFERSSSAPAITDEAPSSVVTKRSLEQIAASEDHVWNSSDRNQADKDTKSTGRKQPEMRAQKREKVDDELLRDVPREAEPKFISPQLALQASSAPEGDDWIHELKLDGYRIQIQIKAGGKKSKSSSKAKLLTRNGLDWTHRMPEIASRAEKLGLHSAILDGEVVVLDAKGRTDFADLQAAFQNGADKPLTYFAFDLLHLDGRNLRNLPLQERKKLLAEVLSVSSDGGVIRLSEHMQAQGDEVFRKACQLGAEGIVSKLLSAPYRSGRGSTWLKVKCIHEQEFVIGGFTPPSKGGHGIGAVLLGYYEGGKLRYAGRAGTGFTQKSQSIVRKQLDKLLQKSPPFTQIPAEARRQAQWVKPVLVAQIAFATWTRDNLLRQAVFKGLREDKIASEVRREEASEPGRKSTKTPKNAQSPAKHPRGEGQTTKVGQRPQAVKDMRLTHPEKIMDADSGLTKQALAEYYMAVSAHILPHIARRPLSVVRCPEGSGKPCFFQKHIGKGMPPGVDSVPVPDPKTGNKEQYLTLSTSEGLVGLTQMGVMEIHPWGSHNDDLEKPDQLIFDLDPDGAIDWKTLAETARKFKSLLKKLGLESFLKSTGGKGLHVVAPIRADHTWPVIKSFAHAFVQRMEQSNPDLYLTKMSKAARKGKIYLDYLRNDRGATAVAPYSSRARAGVPVAVPLNWRELSDAKKPEFHVADFDKWKGRLRRDPWNKMLDVRQHLTAHAILAIESK